MSFPEYKKTYKIKLIVTTTSLIIGKKCESLIQSHFINRFVTTERCFIQPRNTVQIKVIVLSTLNMKETHDNTIVLLAPYASTTFYEIAYIEWHFPLQTCKRDLAQEQEFFLRSN